MTNILVQIKDDRKANDLIRFLRDIDFLDIVVQPSPPVTREEVHSNVNVAFGIWADKKISLDSIRKKAWR